MAELGEGACGISTVLLDEYEYNDFQKSSRKKMRQRNGNNYLGIQK